MKRAVVFDMDGVLIDSEPIQMLAFETLMAGYGVSITREDFLALVGKRSIDNFREIRERFRLSEDAESLNEKKNTVYRRLLAEGLAEGRYTEREGLSPLLSGLSRAGFSIGLASSSPLEDIRITVEGLGVAGFFSALASGDEVKEGKPAPDVFLLAARRLGIPPDRCAVVEDSSPGVASAAAAGMVAVACPNEFTQTQDFSLAHHRVESLTALDATLFERLLDRAGAR